MYWLIPTNTTAPRELINAARITSRYLASDAYRSRTAMPELAVSTAFSWINLHESAINPDNEPAKRFSYKTIAMPRGMETTEAVSIVCENLHNWTHSVRHFGLFVANTATNAEAGNALNETLTRDWEELPLRTLLTINPNHKIRIYYKNMTNGEQPKHTFAVITNQYTDIILFRIAAAMATHVNHLPELGPDLWNAWLAGNAETVCTLLEQYYKDARNLRKQKHFEEQLEKILDKANFTDIPGLQHLVAQREQAVEDTRNAWLTRVRQLEQAKAELFKAQTADISQAAQDLKTFLTFNAANMAHIDITTRQWMFVYNTPLLFWDPEPVKIMLDSPRDNCANSLPAAKKALLKDIFIDKTITLMIESGACIRVNEHTISYYNPTIAIPSTAAKGIPNPHHHYYDCWGDNAPNVQKALMDGDYVQAFAQIFAAIASINITDTAVFRRFCEDELYGYTHIPCLHVKETGALITIDQYVKEYNAHVSNAND